MAEKCKHKADPKTVKVNTKRGGRTATCLKCGKQILLVKWHRNPGDGPRPTMKTTSSDKREAKRRNRD